jgi:hypothetical protein
MLDVKVEGDMILQNAGKSPPKYIIYCPLRLATLTTAM